MYYKGLKIRLYPTKKQEELMWKSVGTARFVYNWTLEKQDKNHKNGGKFIKSNVLREQLTQLKKTDEYGWLNEISSHLIHQAVSDACDNYMRFIKNYAKYPNFKSKNKSKPSFYVRTDNLKPKEKSVNFEKIGRVKIKPNQIPLGIKYYDTRCSYDGKYWYLSVVIKQEENQLELNKDLSIGIDLGVTKLAVLSTGEVYHNINKSKEMLRLKKKLKRLQRQYSRKREMNKQGTEYVKTKNIIKLEKQIKLVYRRITNIRRNYNHHLTSDVIKQRPYRVVIEDLNVKGLMKNRHMSRAIGEQCFYDIRHQFEYKCEKHGIELVLADRWYPSSKICSCCGSIKRDLNRSARTYICKECGLVIDRDLNASINLSMYTQ